MSDTDEDWDDDLIDDGEDEDADIDAQIALAEFHLSALRMTKALREVGRSFAQFSESMRAFCDHLILSQDEISDE